MALFALSATQVYGDGPYLPPTPLPEVCVEDLDNPLTPIPGRPYTYEVNVPSPEGDKTYHWVVTQDQTFIEDGIFDVTDDGFGGGEFLASGSDWYNNPDHDDNTNEITLTWQSFQLDPEEFLFVVIYVINEALDDGCVTDNLKVYRIQPEHAFTLTLGNIDWESELIDDDPEICVDDVFSAVFDPGHGDDGGVVYDYGENAFYYAVAASNFSGDFQLAATFSGLQDATEEGTSGQTATIYWDYTLSGLDEDPNVQTLDGETILGTISPPDGESYGESSDPDDENAAFMIYIKVVVEHNQFEAADADGYEYTLALDAVLADADGTFGSHIADNLLGDQNNLADAEADCGRDPFGLHNQSIQTLRPRPEIQSVQPDPDADEGDFLPNAPQ